MFPIYFQLFCYADDTALRKISEMFLKFASLKFGKMKITFIYAKILGLDENGLGVTFNSLRNDSIWYWNIFVTTSLTAVRTTSEHRHVLFQV